MVISKRSGVAGMAVLFDFDGVIVDSEILKAKAWKIVLGEHSVPDGDKWYRLNIGIIRIELCQRAVKDFNLSIPPEDLARRKVEVSKEIAERESPPTIFPMVDLVRRLAASGITLGVASSQHRHIVLARLREIGIECLFSAVVSGEDDCVRGKPHPDIYLLAAKKLGVPPETCVAVEDTEAGIASAKSARSSPESPGMACIGFQNPNSGNQDLSRADLIVHASVLGALDAHIISEMI